MLLAILRRQRPAVRGFLVVAGVAAFGGLVTGCQSDPDIDITALAATPTDPPDVLYNQGLANMKAGKLSEADSKFQAVDKEHPYSEYARKAILMDTFVNYRQGDYTDAISSGNRYLNLYSGDKDAAYAQYLVGLSYYRQIPDITRDQTASHQTIDAMNNLVTRYPDSPYVEDAQTKIRFARDQLAGKEMQVGRYYLEKRDYLAAINRFRTVVEKYPNTREVEEALARLVEAYYGLGLTDEAQTAAAVLGHNFPDSPWYKDSYKLLTSKGLTPRENKGSWISRAGSAILGGGGNNSGKS